MEAPPVAIEKAVLSVTEVTDGIRALLASPLEALKFKKASEYLSLNGARTAEELRQEAIKRAVGGSRRCRKDLPVLVFLIGTMRSIAFAEMRAIRRKPRLTVISDEHADVSQIGGVDPRRTPEQTLIAEERATEIKSKILALFENDIDAQILAEGMMDEIEGEELRNLLGLDEKKFASKRRFVRRIIDKAYPKGRKL